MRLMRSMEKTVEVTTINKFIFWTPRILVILFILFLAMFSLDIFENTYTFWETVVGLFMHNIPSLILLVILLITWKQELVGAIIFGFLGAAGIVATIIALVHTPARDFFNPLFPILGIVASVVGILFLIGWQQKKKLGKPAESHTHKKHKKKSTHEKKYRKKT
jgi:hypothetical protein